MKNKIAVSCPTKDDWDKVQEKAFSEGLGWNEGRIYREFENGIGGYNCINMSYGKLDYADKAFYERSGYTIIPAEEWLAELKVGDSVGKFGDKVKILNGERNIHQTGAIGHIIEVDPNSKNITYRVKTGSTEGWVYNVDLKLIESEDSMKEERTAPLHPLEYSVPLRVDDKVRVVVKSTFFNEGHEGVIANFYSDEQCGITSEHNLDEDPIHIECLQLIPTEQDIVVGSVWEALGTECWTKGETREVKEVRWRDKEHWSQDKEPMVFEVKHGSCCASVSDFLKNFKLIHRGDEESKVKESFYTGHCLGDSIDIVLNKQTNKKEKKMKREEMEIKLRMPIFDEECGNTGKVVGIFKASDQASYLDDADGQVRTVSMSQLHYKAKLILPEPKPVVKKKKVVKKKAK